MKSSAAISLFERPRAARDATRRSVSVSSSSAGRRPLILRSSALAFSAQSRAPSSSKIPSACSSASREAAFCWACRRTAPRQSRLDRIRPEWLRRVDEASCESSPGKIAQVTGGRLEVPQCELQAAEHAE